LVACGDKDKGAATSAGDNDTGGVNTATDTAKSASDVAGPGGGPSDVAFVDGKTGPVDASRVAAADVAGGAQDGSQGSDVGVAGKYKWFKSCGAPVCKGGPWKSTPGVSLCVDQKEGGACSKLADKCDAKHGCQAFLVCAEKDPKQQQGGCPISSRRYKTNIRYLSAGQEKRIATELLGMPLTSWLYRDGDDKRHLGFIIEDVPGSVAVDKARERVDLYSYISMAVATLKVQQRRIDRLERRLEKVTRSKSPIAGAGQGKPRR
jgi:hypothetical protein